MSILAYADVLEAAGGAVRLYLPDCKCDPKSYNVTFSSCGSLSAFLSRDHGPIIYFREVFDGKSERRIIILFNNNIIGADISEPQDFYRSYLQIQNYVSKNKYVNYMRNSCLGILRQFFKDVPSLKEETDKLIPSVPQYYWPGAFNTREQLPEFIRRVWGDCFSYGLKISHIKTRDYRLWVAINNYRKNHDWPEDLECLSQRDTLKSNVAIFFASGSSELTPKELFSVVRKITRDGRLDHFTNKEIPKRKVIAVKNRKHPKHRAIS